RPPEAALTQVAEKTAPPSAKSSGLALVLGGILGLLVLVGGAFALWKFVFSSPPSNPTTTTEHTTATRSTEASTQKGPEAAEKWIPKRFTAASGAKLLPFQGKQYYDKITRQMPNGQLVNLVLIRPQGAGDPRPFYMMETKVWNDLYAEFRKEGGPA